METLEKDLESQKERCIIPAEEKDFEEEIKQIIKEEGECRELQYSSNILDIFTRKIKCGTIITAVNLRTEPTTKKYYYIREDSFIFTVINSIINRGESLR